MEDINLIAWKHLYGDSLNPDVIQPRSEAARVLYENGLRLPNPQETAISECFNETYSKDRPLPRRRFYRLARTNPSSPHCVPQLRPGRLEPRKYARLLRSFQRKLSLFGSRLYIKRGVKSIHRMTSIAWTSQFAKEKISRNANEAFSQGSGWRMAVILNGSIISSPTLDAALKTAR